jgi:outer membrane immunogenic protein
MFKVCFKSLLLAGAFFPISAAYAADYEPPPPTEDLRPATYDWSGVYVGAWVGAACIDGELDDGTLPRNLSGCGGKGGLAGGVNHQIQNWVLGAEIDYGLGGKVVENYDETAVGDNLHLDSVATARLKLGYAADYTLLFVTAGGAYANMTLTGQDGAGDEIDSNEDMWGWTVGGGIEHALTDNFRVRLDYLYTQYNSKVFGCSPGCAPEVDTDEHEVRVGAFWAFNWF